jgi:N-methylhydantoinase A
MVERVGVEIGGTFTDLVWRRADGSVATHKVLSTPEALQRGVLQALEEAGVVLPATSHLVHGSTVATNALLTRQGAVTGLLATEGFRDVLEIGRHDRVGNIYEVLYRKPVPPVRRAHIREVRERVLSDGRVHVALDAEAAWQGVRDLLDAGVESLAICLLHAYGNPAHERALLALCRERAPNVYVTASHEISPEFREYERSMTTAINAFVGPVVARYVEALIASLGERRFGGVLQVMQSNGGILPAAAVGVHAVRTLFSGPAAGVRGAVWFARRAGVKDAITLDMGGTSTDVCLAPDLSPGTVSELVLGGLPVRTPSLDIVSVGAGGGSVAAIDRGGFLQVGPHSAGARPGPASYGRGGLDPTVTDAQLVAGILRPAQFLGGRMRLHPDRAVAALGRVAQAAALDRAADAVLRMANANLAAAVRLVSTARGVDPREFVLVAYGGAGPVHAALVAEDLEIRRVLVPWSPGLVSGFGLLVADLTVDLVETRIHVADDRSLGPETVERLHAIARAAATARGLAADRCRVSIAVEARYPAQAFELAVTPDRLPATGREIREAFCVAHARRYGYAHQDRPVEIVNYRVRVTEAAGEGPILPGPPAAGSPRVEQGRITLRGAEHRALFAARRTLPSGWRLEGPAVIEEETATTLVPPGWAATVLDTGDLALERSG